MDNRFKKFNANYDINPTHKHRDVFPLKLLFPNRIHMRNSIVVSKMKC